MSFTETVEEAVFGFDFLIIPVNFQTSVTNINVGLVEPGIPPLPDGSRLLSDYAFFSGGPPASVVLYSDPFPVSPPPTSTTIGDNAVILMKTGGWQDIGQYLGLVPGTLYAFSDLSEVPLPTTLPLFATGIGGLGLLGWRRKRKVRAAA